jgi:hypothetical protein
MVQVVFWSARSVPPAALLVLLYPVAAGAEEAPSRLGDTAWALPGVVRVGVPAIAPRRFAAAASAGYGFTEAQSDADGGHNRLTGSLAAAVAPIPALDIALRLDGRYDMHPDDGAGTYSSAVGDPRLLVRGGARVADFHLGGELVSWFPGQDAPSISLEATTVDAKFLGAFAPKSGLVVAANVGFRFDNSENAAPNLRFLRSGDRLALGLSSSNAALVGVGVSVPVAERTDVLGEFSADLLVGEKAPPASQSPMRITAGVRHRVSDAIALQFLAEVSPSGRPSLGPSDPLVPVEPRVSITAGLVYRLPFDAPAPAKERETERPPPVAPVAAVQAKTGELVLRVTGQGGGKVAGGTVEIRSGTETEHVAAGEDGSVPARSLPVGTVHVTVSADGFTPVERDIAIEPGKKQEVSIELAPAPPSGQLRGLVRSFNGRGLAASIRVEPLGVEAKADADGNFTLDVPPGNYEVVVRAEHFKAQRRKVHIDQNGVTVLNAELFEGK